MGRIYLSEEENKWTEDCVKKHFSDGKMSTSKVAKLGLHEECERLFGRKISVAGLYSRLHDRAAKLGFVEPRQKRR